jgi:transposase InsO family protein
VKLYTKHDLFRFHRDVPLLHRIRCRYVAEFVNLFWHTDLHLYKRTNQWLMAFLDDASRRIIAFAFLPDKSSESTAVVLLQALATVDIPPYAVWSDNGTEFKGDFEAVLQEHGVRHVRTKPYNPEQNGKIERFWPTVEEWKGQGSLAVWIEKYNARPQTSLPLFEDEDGRLVRMTPDDAYEELERWGEPQNVPMWVVNGRHYRFPGALHQADPSVEFDPLAGEDSVREERSFSFDPPKPKRKRRPSTRDPRHPVAALRKNQ